MGLIWLLKSMILFILYQKICMFPYDATVDTSKKDETPWEVGWIHHGKYSYKMEKEELNWGAAVRKCRMMGGFLATIHSKEQNDFFEVLSNKTDVGYWWFGLHDQDSDGIFSWVDETDFNYTNWRSDEPYGDYDSGNCVAISFRHYQENHGKWFVLPCNDKVPYLCQMQVHLFQGTTVDDVSRNEGQSCENGWIYEDKYCYKMEKEELNWDAADSKCRMMGGFLATVHSKEQNDFFEVLSISTDVGYWWFGLHDQDSDGIFSWVDETDVNFTNWRSNDPHGDYDSGNCVAISYHIRPTDQGKWYVLPCENKVPYLCQKQTRAHVSTVAENDVSTTAVVNTVAENDVSNTTVDDVSKKEGPSCEEGWIYKDQYCFKLEEKERSWTDASKECKKMNGHLITIHSEKQNENLKYIAEKTGEVLWWIGLHDQDFDNTFSWDDNSDLNYTKWRPGEPDGDYESGDCVAVSFLNKVIYHGMWLVFPCQETFPYLCQKQLAAIITTETETQTTYLIQDITVDDVSKKEEPSCEDGWIYKDQYCFKMEKNERNWVDASKECKKMNGNLVSIHSEKENENLENIAEKTGVYYWWIGLHDQDMDNTFSWDDNSELNYTKWRPKETYVDYGSVSTMSYMGNCVAISFIVDRIDYELWFVLPCRSSIPYLCKKQPVSTNTTTENETETRFTNTVTESETKTIATIITTAAETQTTVFTNTATESENETTVAAIITTETETQTTASKSTTTENETETTTSITENAELE